MDSDLISFKKNNATAITDWITTDDGQLVKVVICNPDCRINLLEPTESPTLFEKMYGDLINQEN